MNKTFPLGGVHPDDSKISAAAAFEVFPLPQVAYISLSQHIGAPAEPVVQAGQKVKAGELIAKASGFISAPVHSSVSGTVRGVVTVRDLAGNPVKAVAVDVEGDEWVDSIDRSDNIVREISIAPSEIVSRIAEAGIVGLGGATFPTCVKLSVPPGKKVEYLVINGAECEPYLTSDFRIMMEYPEQFLIGVRLLRLALGVPKAYVGVEVNKMEAISLLGTYSCSYPDIEVVPLKKKYPQGGEKQLIKAVTGRAVPSMGLPIDVGAVVQNVGTAFAVYEAVQKNKPLFETFMTVTGRMLPAQHNIKVRVGVPLSEVAGHFGGVPESCAKVVSGGPMMGKAVYDLSAPVLKGTSSLLFLDARDTERGKEGPCIRCAKCVEACPMGLEPYLLNKLGRRNRTDELEAAKVYDCIECGCCSYTCPSNIPLLDTIRVSKAAVMKIMRSRHKK